jgi:hypothetical protein
MIGIQMSAWTAAIPRTSSATNPTMFHALCTVPSSRYGERG